MRSVADIKQQITQEYLNSSPIADKYPNGIGRVSIESILFGAVAIAIYVVESLFDLFRKDVTEQVEAQIAHRPTWYARKARAFMPGKVLVEDSDYYDTAGMTEEDITAAQVVKYAVAMDSPTKSRLIVKVAGEESGARAPLPADTAVQLKAYLDEIRDAGVIIDLINEQPEGFNCSVNIYYDPILNPDDVKVSCTAAINNYIANIEFNGEYSNNALVDTLQLITGVKLVHFIKAEAVTPNTTIAIPVRYTPAAGYFKQGELTIEMIANDPR